MTPYHMDEALFTLGNSNLKEDKSVMAAYSFDHDLKIPDTAFVIKPMKNRVLINRTNMKAKGLSLVSNFRSTAAFFKKVTECKQDTYV